MTSLRQKASRMGLPQLPKEIKDGKGPTPKFLEEQLRAIYDLKKNVDLLLDQVQGGPSSDANAFAHVAVSGQTTVDADAVDDTVTFIAGTNVTITTNATNDSVTFNATGGSSGPPTSSGEHLLMLGDIAAAQDDATMALGMIGQAATARVIFGGTIWLTMVGGGAGGGSTTGTTHGGGGGGAGESCEGLPIAVTPGGSYSYSVGAGGAADTDGGTTTFGNFSCLGGKKGSQTQTGGNGGGARGATPLLSIGQVGGPESASFFGGSSGGDGVTGTGSSNVGGGSGGYFTGGAATSGAGGSGGGGGASIYSHGGDGGSGAGSAATGYGGGGGGAGGTGGAHTAGAGAGGYILITYVGGAVEFTTGSGTWVAPT